MGIALNTQERIDLAFSQLGLREPFIAAVMTRIKREVTDSIPTAATDGLRILYNPDFVEKQGKEELFGLTLHEALHIILEHMWRRGDRDPKLWNYANDAIINAYILKRGYKLPDGGVFLSWVKEDMDSEYVYRKLKEQQDDEGGDGDCDGGGFDGQGDLMDAPNDATRADLQATILASAEMAKAAGQGSALIDRIIENAGKSTVDWRSELRCLLTESAADDYSYRRFSRRFIGSGLYLPSLYSEALGGLVVAIDTSASMTQQELDQIAAELHQIFEDLRPAWLRVVYCDSDIAGEEHFEYGDVIQLTLKGGGGTRFKPVFDYVDEMDVIPVGIVYFTDMEGNLTECQEPQYPVVWANTGGRNHSAPFGVVTNVEI